MDAVWIEDAMTEEPASMDGGQTPEGESPTATRGTALGWASLLTFTFVGIGLIVVTLLDWQFATTGARRPFAGHVVAVLVILGMMAPLMVLRFHWAQVVAAVVLLAGIYAVYLIPWTTRKPFLRDLGRVRLEMTLERVESIMGGYQTGAGWEGEAGSAVPGVSFTGARKPGYTGQIGPDGTFTGSITFRHSNLRIYKGDFGVVTFRQGKVVGIGFPPDMGKRSPVAP